MYAVCPLRKSQNINKFAICQILSRFIGKHVMQRQEINILLPCSCKVGEKWLCSRTYSGITRNRPARLGLLYLFIVGGQCHTRPLTQVAGVLGCCTPVGKLARRPLFTVTFWMPDSLCDGTHLTGLARPTKHQQSTSPEIIQRWPTPNAKLHPENNH